MKPRIPDLQPRIKTFLLVGVWFGLFAGLIEGIGLLAFQHINWLNAARMIHESEEILWVSPLVDVPLFLIVALFCGILSRLMPKLPALRIAVFLMAGLAVFDWLWLTERLYLLACISMAIGAGFAFQRWFSQHQESALRMYGRTVPWLAALVVLAVVGVRGSSWWSERSAIADLPPAVANSPNVVYVIFDALRADHVSAYGYPRLASPELDKLAKEGVLFEKAISTSSWSLPSHASLVTGRYQYEHGADNPQRIPWFGWGYSSFNRYPTIAEALQKKGYRTGAFSANRAFFTRTCGFGRGFAHFEDYFNSPEDAFSRTLYGRVLLQLYLRSIGRRLVLRKRADEVNRELTQWIDRDRQRPFFAMLNYFDVHDPYGGPESYPKPGWELKTTIDSYDAGLKYDDAMLAQMLHQFEQRGLDKNTIIVIVSDHGESLGQHGLNTHGRALYWELLHVPLIVWYPEHIPSGLRVARPVSTASIPATIMDLVDPGHDNTMPPPALSQLWKSPGSEANWPVPLAEIARNPYPEDMEKIADQTEPTSTTGAMKSLVTQQYQILEHENLGTQIYDVDRDPGEQKNLIYDDSGIPELSRLDASLQTVLGKLSSDQRTARIKSAKAIQNGAFNSPSEQQSANDYFLVTASPGASLTVEAQTKGVKPTSHLDPVLSIEDSQGQPFHTCRNPGDDQLRTPGVDDFTPNAFDDLCINDDVKAETKDSKLEIMVPPSASRNLYVHVIDWNQTVQGRKNYRLVVSGATTN